MSSSANVIDVASIRRPSAPAIAPLFASQDKDDVGELLGALYNGPLESNPWGNALRLLQDRLQAAHVALITRPPSTDHNSVMVTSGPRDADAELSYDRNFVGADPFATLRDGLVMTPEDIVGADWREGVMYRKYLRPLGVHDVLAANLHTDDGAECRLRITRSKDVAPFGNKEKSLIYFILPHLRRALELQARMDTLECSRAALSGTVDRLQLGVITLDEDGAILDRNAEAQRILAQRDGLSLTTRGLQVEHVDERRELQRLIQAALDDHKNRDGNLASTFAEAMAVTRFQSSTRLALMVKAMPRSKWSEDRHRPSVLLLLRDPDTTAEQDAVQLVRRIVGLTRVEARLALLLTDGVSLDEASEMLGIQRNTVRTHLRSIFCKTGVARQSQLVRLLLKTVLSLG